MMEAQPSVRSGERVDGYRIARVVAARAGIDTLADAEGPDGVRVTLKLLEQPLAGKEQRRRVTRLARLRASLVHPHALPLVGDGTDRRRLVLGALPAGAVTLADRLRDGPLAPGQAVVLASQVAGALEAGLRRDLPHRDLSPATILVSGDDEPRALLTDFGITLPHERGCRLRAAIAEAAYRSPEELRGQPPAAASAVYSLACVLTACLTGSPPFAYERPLLVMHAQLTEAPPSLSERRPALPEELDRVVARALAKDPRHRHASPAAFMRAVQRALGVAAPIPLRGAPAEVSPARSSRPRAPAASPAKRAAATTASAAPARRAPAARRRARRSRTPARRRRPAALRLAPGRAGVALLVSAVAGFAGGQASIDGDETSPPEATPAQGLPASGTPAVAPLVGRLDTQRSAARRRLSSARRAESQAAWSTRLARLYRAARSGLLRTPADVTGKAALADSLGAVEAAYRGLARAAERGSPRAWRRASEEVRDREDELELLLRTRPWT